MYTIDESWKLVRCRHANFSSRCFQQLSLSKPNNLTFLMNEQFLADKRYPKHTPKITRKDSSNIGQGKLSKFQLTSQSVTQAKNRRCPPFLSNFLCQTIDTISLLIRAQEIHSNTNKMWNKWMRNLLNFLCHSLYLRSNSSLLLRAPLSNLSISHTQPTNR